MRFAIFGDIHANLEALQAVLKDAEKHEVTHQWGYVFNHLDAAASFNRQHTQICFYGHTHAPRAYIRNGSVKSQFLEKLTVEPGKKYFINCGSVGQPRDGDWRAAYVLYTPDSQLIELRRLEYDIGAAQDKIRRL